MEDTVVKMQIAHNDFVDKDGNTEWFNIDGSTLSESPEGTEANL